MQIGCAFAAGFEAARQAEVAESLGFDYIGFYDSPALETEVWLTLSAALRATRRIRIGTYVLIPHLRHPMAQAAAISTLCHEAPGRLEVAMGTGFTGRMAMGQRPLTWAFMRRFVEQLRGLLAGEDVEIDGATTRMLHPPGFAPPRPIEVPLLLAANGPKGVGVARECADGLVYMGDRAQVPAGFEQLVMPIHGVVLEKGERYDSERVVDAARVMFTLNYHLAYDSFTRPAIRVTDLPHGDDWLATVEKFPEQTRHMHVHDRHMVSVNDHDYAFSERHRDSLVEFSRQTSRSAAQVRETADKLEAEGVTRVMAELVLPDWERGLRNFAAAFDR